MLAHTLRMILKKLSGVTQKNITRCLRTFEKTERSRTLFSFKTARNKMSDSAEYADVSKSNQRWQYLRRVWRPLPLSLLFATVGVVQWNYIKKKHTKEPVEEAKDWEVTCYRSVPLRLVSRSWGWFSNLELPEPLRTRLISAYITKFGCNLEEAAVTNLSAYRSLADFFCRELRHDARPIAATDCLVSPADGSVVNIGRVSSSKVEQVKGVTYTLEAFLGPHTWKPVSQEDNGGGTADQEYQKSLLHNKNNVLYQYVVYLAPGDYHRFHSPVDWDVIFRRHFQGELLSVNPVVAQVVPELFSLNERAVYIGQWKHGFFSMTAVGATNVGCIRVYCDPSLKTNERKWRRGEKRRDLFLSGEGGGPVHIEKGELFGEFRMGSTIVVLFEAPPDFTFRVEHGQRILVGEAISECLA
ncbi:phosphatidylserine decarboxylase proenzyme, mitochondrial [Schistocerca americana]|uniref:phosphatidylserine decarboxylase proenzyme, mitochondrial n=1 Tax=Schistocerca americana TaxID=7009 RepID=UPI001F4F792A|nr:phosphatidylserine decarboxylase proenzyme, mitochondrial [Schistocerca americana]XP_049942314.1 phosphatidylserine decarboxylase proenzyme, mitochondrial [Schistocerca serialis cubense]